MSARPQPPPEQSDSEPTQAHPAPGHVEIALRLPAATLVRIVVALGIVWALLRLLPAIAIFLVAVLLALTMAPAVRRLEKWGTSRALAVSILAAVAIGVGALFVTTVLPPLISQTLHLSKHVGAYRRRVEAHLKPNYPVLATVMDQVLSLPSSPEVAESSQHKLEWGGVIAKITTAIVLTLALTFYLLIDGKRTYAWLLAYVPRRHRRKMALTMPAVSDVVRAYVLGQCITSILAGAYAFGVLSLLKVPAVFPLALLAAVCDVLPVLGVFISTTPAVLFAFTVSPLVGGEVFILYLLYHALENSVIIPRVYGKRLRLSTLVVLVALIIGGVLGGVLGAILVLPFVAAYPIVERVWLHGYLSDDVVTGHSVLEKADPAESESAVDAILRGAKLDAERSDPSAAHEARQARRESKGFV
jgi:predicted PurR-regulated permease PerM